MRNAIGISIAGPGPAITSVALGGVGNSPSVYPTVTDSRLWLDRNANVYSDTGGTTPASVDGSVGSWRAVGGSWGTDLVTQATGSRQPTLKSDGLQADGVDDFLTCSVALAGDFTLYFVATRSATNVNACLASYTGDRGFFVAGDNNTIYAATDASTWISKTGFTGLSTTPFIVRYRVSGTTLYIKASGHAEQSQAGVTVPASTLTRLLYASSVASASGARFRQMVLVNRDLTHGGTDDLAIRAALATLEPGVIDL